MKIKNLLSAHGIHASDGQIGSLDMNVQAIFLCYLSDETYTGINMRTFPKLLREMDVSKVVSMTCRDLFPEVYMNNLLSETDKIEIEMIRLCEFDLVYRQVLAGKEIVYPRYEQYGEKIRFYYSADDGECSSREYEEFDYKYMLSSVYTDKLPRIVNNMVCKYYKRELNILNYENV